MPVKRRNLQSSALPVAPADTPASVPVSFPNQRLLRIPQAAIYLACSVWAVRDLLRRKELTKIPLGRKYLIDRAQLDAYIERIKAKATA